MSSLVTDEIKKTSSSVSGSNQEYPISKYNWVYSTLEDSGRPIFMEAFHWKNPEKIESTIWDLVSVDNEIDNIRHEINKIKKNKLVEDNNKNKKYNLSIGDLQKISRLNVNIEYLNVIQTDAKIDEKTGNLILDERTDNNLQGNYYIRKTGKEASDIRKQFVIELYNNFNSMENSEYSVLSPARPRKLSKDGSESSNEDIKKETTKKLKNTVKRVIQTNATLKRLQTKNRNWRQTSKDNLTSLFQDDNKSSVINSSQESQESQGSQESDDTITKLKMQPKIKKRRVGFGESRTVDYDTQKPPREIQRSLSLESRSTFQDDFLTPQEEEEINRILSNASDASDDQQTLLRDADLMAHFSISPFLMHQTTDEMQDSLHNDKILPNFANLPPSIDPLDNNNNKEKSIYTTYEISDSEISDSELDDSDEVHPFFRKSSPTGSVIGSSFTTFKSPQTLKKMRKKNKNSSTKPIKLHFGDDNKDKKRKRESHSKGGKKKKTKKKSKKKKKKTRRKR